MAKQDKIKAWAVFLKAYYPVFLFACKGTKKPKDHWLVRQVEKIGQKCIYKECEIKFLD